MFEGFGRRRTDLDRFAARVTSTNEENWPKGSRETIELKSIHIAYIHQIKTTKTFLFVDINVMYSYTTGILA